MHRRRQIREAVKTHLLGLSQTGSRVETGRTRPLADGHQPTLLIYTPTDRSGLALAGHPEDDSHELQLIIDIRVCTAGTPEDDLDDIAEEIEALMAETAIENALLGRLIVDAVLVSTDTEVKAEGKNHLGAMRLEYRVRY